MWNAYLVPEFSRVLGYLFKNEAEDLYTVTKLLDFLLSSPCKRTQVGPFLDLNDHFRDP